ncbi:MAG: DUF3413 domain-containing protein [Venatoribacter sp.]
MKKIKLSFSSNFKQLAVFSVLNLPLTWLISLRFLSVEDISSFSEVLYLALVFLGHFGFTIHLAFFPVALLGALLPKRLMAVVAVLAFASLQLLLFIDTFVFNLYRFHFSGFIFDLLFNGGGDVFQFSFKMWATAALVVAVLLALQLGLWWAAARTLSTKKYATMFALSFVAALIMHSWHAWDDANYITERTAFTPNFPLFFPVTASDKLIKWGLVDPQLAREKVNWKATKKQKLNYPLSPVQCSQPETQHNLLILLVDTLRADVFNPSDMPNLYRFAQKPSSFSLPKHFSGGNSTKAGVFSLFYGLPVSYWNAITNSSTQPVLMQKLQQAGYEFKVLSSATLVSPAFDRNIFAGLDVELYTAGGVPWQRDRTIADKWQEWLNQRNSSQPYMGFLFFDAVHGYSTPSDFPKVEPYWESISHIELNKDFDRTPYFNRYRTAVRYVDGLLGEVLDGLERSGALENTVVLVTSDHGESFNEHGKNYWGHGSNYSFEQTHVPVVMHWPKARKPVARRTSHADLPVTLVEELLGCSATDYAYSLGKNVFSERADDWIISGSYTGEAVLLPDYYIDIDMAGNARSFDYQVTAQKDKKMSAAQSLQVMKALSQFYK